MDEASIVSALQENLQDYKVKIQIRRKESQMHILLTREDGDDLDYALLYDIVKNRIDKLSIEWANSFIVYGRLSGTKQPEWQREGNIKPALPLIELDLDDLDDLEEIESAGNLKLLIPDDETLIQVGDLGDPIAIESGSVEPNALELGNLELGNLDLHDLDLHDLDFGENTSVIINDFNSSNQRSPQELKDDIFVDVDAEIEATELAPLVPLPPKLPPKGKVRPPTKISATPKSEPAELSIEVPSRKPFWISVAIVGLSVVVLGACGWLLWERSTEQKTISDARNILNKNLNLQQVRQLGELTETRNQLQNTIASLEAIPDRPMSLYGDAQTELTALRPKFEEFDRKVNLEQDANKKLELSKSITLEAVKLTQNAPHRSTVWQSALDKRQQAIKLLEDIPPSSLLYPKVQERLKGYRPELAQITKWTEIQKRAEASVSSIRPESVTQLKQLKVQVGDKSKFLSQCSPMLQSQVTYADLRQTGLPANKLTEYLCAYFWGLE